MPFLPARARRPTSSGKQAAMAKAAPVSASSSTSTLGASPPSFLAKQALEHFNRAEDALTDQDWARYGENSKRCVGCLAKGAGQVDPFAPVATSKSRRSSPVTHLREQWRGCGPTAPRYPGPGQKPEELQTTPALQQDALGVGVLGPQAPKSGMHDGG